MTGDRVKEHYYRNWIYVSDDKLWYFMDPQFKDHGPFDNYLAAERGVDEYLRRASHGNDKEDAVGEKS